ncbi:MAG TPA: phosphatidylglycerophosphatase A [Ramlibacter sp.]|uniref:phosphatidylglycerophosphatase A family protein n=1 Tax=Ramlibacter sp. TaxID=1917967 RepID=UPI002CC098E5|nr:phosphatidylglycerophosphatase A [Ramlibacter sp.]HVZ46177.1 phosphatidylglycerophosphatase A [Ramlibacter sp.]
MTSRDLEAGGIARPTARFLLAHPAHLIALGFGSGLAPVAPGTCGTLWAWLAYLVLASWLNPFAIGVVILVSFFVGWWACTVAATNLRIADPGCVVWDEVIAFWIVLWLVMPAGFTGQLAAFVLFRLLDTFKPGPVGWADTLFKGFGWRAGFGIILDDLVAGFCTLFLIALARRLWT